MQSPGHIKGQVEFSERKQNHIYLKKTIIHEQILPDTLDKHKSPVKLQAVLFMPSHAI